MISYVRMTDYLNYCIVLRMENYPNPIKDYLLSAANTIYSSNGLTHFRIIIKNILQSEDVFLYGDHLPYFTNQSA